MRKYMKLAQIFGTEISETNNEPTFRLKKILTPKKLSKLQSCITFL